MLYIVHTCLGQKTLLYFRLLFALCSTLTFWFPDGNKIQHLVGMKIFILQILVHSDYMFHFYTV